MNFAKSRAVAAVDQQIAEGVTASVELPGPQFFVRADLYFIADEMPTSHYQILCLRTNTLPAPSLWLSRLVFF
jgi:hypothetical protein